MSITVAERFIGAAGRRARYLESGDGEPVVILASMLVLASAYRPLILELARRGFQVIVVEMPGSGFASKIERPWSFDQYADWLANSLVENQLRRPTLIGHSNSGSVALTLAGANPSLISRLILTDTIGFDRRKSIGWIILGRAYDALLETRLTFRGFWQLPFNLAQHPWNFLNQTRLPGRTDLRALARKVCVPTLLAWGARDHTTPPQCLRVLQENLPRAETYVSQRGSHDWLITHAREYADAVSAFIKHRARADDHRLSPNRASSDAVR